MLWILHNNKKIVCDFILYNSSEWLFCADRDIPETHVLISCKKNNRNTKIIKTIEEYCQIWQLSLFVYMVILYKIAPNCTRQMYIKLSRYVPIIKYTLKTEILLTACKYNHIICYGETKLSYKWLSNWLQIL